MTTNSSHIAHGNALLTIFTSAARVAVLRVFMLDPRREYYQRQIESATGLPIRAVQRELERLTAAGLLYRRLEGNRTYYQVDITFPLFPELRGMVMKSVSPVERLRGRLAVDETVRLVLLCEADTRVLVVTTGSQGLPTLPELATFKIDILPAEAFLQALSEHQPMLEPYLEKGIDLLGRREDVLWRRIESSGYKVEKGRGVP